MAGRSLGTLTLDLIAKTGGFEQGMDKAGRASSRTSKQIAADAERAAARSKAAFGSIAKFAMGALAGVSVGVAFKSIIDNTRVAEQEQAQLAAVLKSTGNAAGYTKDQLNGMASALAGKSVLSVGEINQAQTALLAFTGVMGGEFVRAQQSAADMAARTGMSIVQTTELIGRALDVPSQGMAALSRQGFRFSEDQKKLIQQFESTGEAAKAQGIILEALEESYGGAAQAARDTFGGAITAVKKTLTDLTTGKDGSLEGARLAIEEFNAALESEESKAAFAAVVSSVASGAGVIVKSLTAIPWPQVTQAVAALSAMIATRYVVSLGAATIASTQATYASIKHQASLSAVATASGVTTSALIAQTAAARAAAAAMALVGGPVGVAILAATAVAYFATRTNEAEEAAKGAAERVAQLGDNFEKLGKDKAAQALRDFNLQLEDQQAKADKASKEVERLQGIISRNPSSQFLERFKNELIDAKAALSDARDEIAATEGSVHRLQGAINNISLRTVANAASQAFIEMNGSLQEQIDLMGAQSDAQRLAIRISKGYITGLKEGEDAELVRKQLILDKDKQMQEQRSKAESAAKSAASQRASTAKSAASRAAAEAKAVIDKAAAEAKALQDTVDALALQEKQLGMTASEVQLYNLSMRRADDAQMKAARSALAAVDAFAEMKSVNEAAFGVLEGLQTEEEAIMASYEKRREIILTATNLTEEARSEAMLRLRSETDEELLALSDDYWTKYLEAAKGNLESFDELAGNAIENFSSSFGSAFESMIFDAESLGDAMRGMAQGMARSVINALGQMAAQWLAYKVVQLMTGKATQASGATQLAANAAATSLQAGLAAFASTAAIPIVGPALAPAAMAAATAATAPVAASVGAVALTGIAHDGIDAVPKTGTWLLEKGERVMTSKTSARLDAALARLDSGANSRHSNGQSNSTVNINIQAPDGYVRPDSVRQIEAASYRALQRSARRNA